VFQHQKEAAEKHATGEEDERRGEVEYLKRLARLALGLVLLAGSGHPELLKSFHLACT